MTTTSTYSVSKRSAWARAALGLAAAVIAAGCHQGMWNNARIKPFEAQAANPLFATGALALPAGVVPFEAANTDEFLYTGKINGEYATSFPFEITRDVLLRGQERYNIFCAPCHSRIGDGKGMIVQREMKQAGNYHLPRLVESPPGYFFDVMTNGFGVMYGYASRVSPEDRWAIAAYIRVLQLSQNATLADVPADERDKLLNPQAGPQEQTNEASHGAH